MSDVNDFSGLLPNFTHLEIHLAVTSDINIVTFIGSLIIVVVSVVGDNNYKIRNSNSHNMRAPTPVRAFGGAYVVRFRNMNAK